MNKQTIAQCDPRIFACKRVLVRVDFNVPLNPDQSVADDSRIIAAMPTIEHLRRAGARVVLVSHLGRPKGPSEKLSLRTVAGRLSQLLSTAVKFVPCSVGPEAQAWVNSLDNGEVCLLENVRFHPEEETNDREFARQLAMLCDVYVNDAFGTAHRAHASTQGITEFVRPAIAGLLMKRELEALSEALDNPTRPLATIIGGAKVSSKIGVLENLLLKADILVIGGAMAFTFLKAQGKGVGKSLVEDTYLEVCRNLEKKAREKGVQFVLPVDVVCAPEMKAGLATTVVSVDSIPHDQMGLDIGPKTVELVLNTLRPAKTILWNGPLGVFEIPGFEKATFALIEFLSKLTSRGVKTIIGGGDSVAAIEATGTPATAFGHVSTGGGASLEFMEGRELPGVICLDEAKGVTSSAGY